MNENRPIPQGSSVIAGMNNRPIPQGSSVIAGMNNRPIPQGSSVIAGMIDPFHKGAVSLRV
ncbi:hypothetical protein DPMN_044590 [Dreissena polymorpha]|uniref:Uncharacterized protein n=1 Tax=Dreissena polymorpha TaxID=45954 RepID=A0A9D4D642_DREPO|nr:hypothetical protein DPMN_044590 [Dreissena polymorpha]